MKRTKFSLVVLLVIFLFSCDQSSIQEYSDITEDPLYIEYSNEIESLFTDVQPKDNLNLNLTKKQILDEFEQSDDITKTLGKYLENPEFYIEKMRSVYLKAQILKERYPEVEDPSSIKTSYTKMAYAGDAACYQQYQTDISECNATAYLGAAICGWTAPTLGGALACGAAVIAYREICDYYANRTWENCSLAN